MSQGVKYVTIYSLNMNADEKKMRKDLADEAGEQRDHVFIEEKDVLSDLTGPKGSSLFLGSYSMSEVAAVLGRKNFFREARKRGLWPLEFALDSSEFPVQRYQIFYAEKKPGNLIADLKIREGNLVPKDYLDLNPVFFVFDFLILDWLTLQNPRQSFSRKRPPLPGQEHPGLGLGRKVVDLFIYLAKLTRKDGILAFPAYFHNALLFSRFFQFLNPEKQGEVLAIRKSLSDIPFKHLAWIVYLNCLREEGRVFYEWKAQEQVYPLNRGLKDYFDSKDYKNRVRESQKGRLFTIDWDCYDRKISALIAEKKEQE